MKFTQEQIDAVTTEIQTWLDLANASYTDVDDKANYNRRLREIANLCDMTF